MAETSRSEIRRILQKLDEKFINKEIDETIYNELKAKYEKQLKEKAMEDAKKLLAEYRPSKTPSADIVEEPKKVGKIGTGKKMAIAILVLIVLVGIVWISNEIQQREAMRNVEVSLSDVHIKSIGFTSATVDIYLNMYNPNSRTTATLDRLDYSIYANGNYLGNGYVSQRVDIPPLSTKTLSTPFQVKYSGALSAIWSALTQGEVNWNLKGTAYFDTPIGTFNIPIDIYK